MKYELYLHDTAHPERPAAVVKSTTSFSPISVGDRIIGQGFPLEIGAAYTVGRLDHSFPDVEGEPFHRVDAYLVP